MMFVFTLKTCQLSPTLLAAANGMQLPKEVSDSTADLVEVIPSVSQEIGPVVSMITDCMTAMDIHPRVIQTIITCLFYREEIGKEFPGQTFTPIPATHLRFTLEGKQEINGNKEFIYEIPKVNNANENYDEFSDDQCFL